MRLSYDTVVPCALALLILSGCASKEGYEGTGTATPPVDNFQRVVNQVEKSEARVSAGVQVARDANNKGQQDVVENELSVVASYLPLPDPKTVAYVAERAKRGDPAEYKRAEEAGRKLMAVIDANFAKAEQDAKKNMAALDGANKRINELQAEIEKVRTEGVRNAMAIVAGLSLLSALALALLGQYLRAATAFVVGAGIGGLPYLFASAYFLPGVAALVLMLLALLWFYLRNRRSVGQNTLAP